MYISDVIIEYSTNNGLNWNTIVTMPNSGSHNWLVPVVDSNQCLVRISKIDDPSISDTSNSVFKIESPPIHYSGGRGLPSDPYRIATAEDLNDIGNHKEHWNKHFIIINDINLVGYPATQFKNIGNNEKRFTGVFDGNDHKIWNSTVCLFGYLGEGGEIKSLGMENVDVNSVSNVGGLVVVNDQGTIRNCYSTGSVSGRWTVDGLVGQNGSFWMECEGDFCWFFLGEAWIYNCYSTCSVSGTRQCIGGLVGENNATIMNCYSTGNVSGYVDPYLGGIGIGGLVGGNNGRITNAYSTGSVLGNTQVGGLVGNNMYPVKIRCDPNWCWTLLWGYGGAKDSFWDIQTSGEPNSAGGTPKTTEEMKTKNTFTGAGWDFVNLWDICEGTNYSRLRWQIPLAISIGDFVCPYGVDFMDFAVISSTWLSKPGEPDWNPACDISNPKDSVIDELDLAVFCENWLKGM